MGWRPSVFHGVATLQSHRGSQPPSPPWGRDPSVFHGVTTPQSSVGSRPPQSHKGSPPLIFIWGRDPPQPGTGRRREAALPNPVSAAAAAHSIATPTTSLFLLGSRTTSASIPSPPSPPRPVTCDVAISFRRPEARPKKTKQNK